MNRYVKKPIKSDTRQSVAALQAAKQRAELVEAQLNLTHSRARFVQSFLTLSLSISDYFMRLNQAQEMFDVVMSREETAGVYSHPSAAATTLSKTANAIGKVAPTTANTIPEVTSKAPNAIPEVTSKASNAMPKAAARKSPGVSSFPLRCLSWFARLLKQGVLTSLKLVVGAFVFVIFSIIFCWVETTRVLRVARGKSNPSGVGWLPFFLLLPIKLLSIPFRVLAFAATPITSLVVALQFVGVRGLLKSFGVLEAKTWRQKVYFSLRMMFYLTIGSSAFTLLSLPYYAFSAMCAVWNSHAFIDVWLHNKLGGPRLCARLTCDQPYGIILMQQHCSYLPAYEKWFYPLSTTRALASDSAQNLDEMVADDKVNFLSATILSMIQKQDRSQKFSLYSWLGCSKSDDETTIKRKVRGIMRKQHPDKCQGNRSTVYDSLSSAKSVLCDNPLYRCVYDAYGDDSLELLAVPIDVCAHIRSLKEVLKTDSGTPVVKAVPASTFATTPLRLGYNSCSAPASSPVSQAAPATPR